MFAFPRFGLVFFCLFLPAHEGLSPFPSPLPSSPGPPTPAGLIESMDERTSESASVRIQAAPPKNPLRIRSEPEGVPVFFVGWGSPRARHLSDVASLGLDHTDPRQQKILRKNASHDITRGSGRRQHHRPVEWLELPPGIYRATFLHSNRQRNPTLTGTLCVAVVHVEDSVAWTTAPLRGGAGPGGPERAHNSRVFVLRRLDSISTPASPRHSGRIRPFYR